MPLSPTSMTWRGHERGSRYVWRFKVHEHSFAWHVEVINMDLDIESEFMAYPGQGYRNATEFRDRLTNPALWGGE